MGLNFLDLTAEVREHMAAEAEGDRVDDRLYLSKRFTPAGRAAYPALLLQAIASGSDDTLAMDLEAEGCMATRERGGRRVPHNAAQTLAESEFNRFYIRGLCRLVVERQLGEVEVYRAKRVQSPRWRSEALIGRRYDPEELLEQIRASIGVEGAFGLPPGPNSGISVRLVS